MYAILTFCNCRVTLKIDVTINIDFTLVIEESSATTRIAFEIIQYKVRLF